MSSSSHSGEPIQGTFMTPTVMERGGNAAPVVSPVVETVNKSSQSDRSSSRQSHRSGRASASNRSQRSMDGTPIHPFNIIPPPPTDLDEFINYLNTHFSTVLDGAFELDVLIKDMLEIGTVNELLQLVFKDPSTFAAPIQQ